MRSVARSYGDGAVQDGAAHSGQDEDGCLRNGIIKRVSTSPHGTFWELMLDRGHTCVTLELPWRGNAKGKSCIPPGTYLFKWRTDSPKHGACYEMVPDSEAPNRTNVQIHAANLAGDSDQGYVAQLEGCIAPGISVMTFRGGSPPAGN